MRKAPSLVRSQVPLAGWLYSGTHYAAANVVCTEQRRRRRGQEAYAMQDPLDDLPSDAAWAQVRPELDSVMHRPDRGDRGGIVQRCYPAREQSMARFRSCGTPRNLSVGSRGMR